MFEIMKTVISARGYKLAEIQHKIKKLYAMGDLTEKQTDQLLSLAQEGISTEAERPELAEMIQSLAKEIDELKNRVRSLEGNSDEEEHTAYPVWKPWDGISTAYLKGAVISHNGQLWKSVYEGQNVWEPGTVDEQFWVSYPHEI